jgi:outer membrane receptor protein involved in Fe transport
VRLGARHSFSPDSVLLGSFMYQEADFDSRLDPPFTFFTSKGDQKAFSGELQHLFRSPYINITSGVGHFDIDAQFDLTIGLDIPPPFGPGAIEETLRIPANLKHNNIYVYSYIKALSDLTFTLGFSADFLDSDDAAVGKEDQFNPKFGVVWNPFPNTTLRGAAFRTLKRTLITNQTLEPTQVAGFNQFFDDFDGTDSWRYGLALDQRLAKNVYGGLEFAYRDLDVPSLDFDAFGNQTRRESDADERLGRAYLFWTPHEWWAVRAEYMYEKFETEVPGLPKNLKTHRLPLGISFFHPSGLSAGLTATYWKQDIRDVVLLDGSMISDTEDFWLVDLAFKFRLPKRYGLVTAGVTNLTDKKFKFFDTDLNNPRIQPDRTMFVQLTLAFP